MGSPFFQQSILSSRVPKLPNNLSKPNMLDPNGASHASGLKLFLHLESHFPSDRSVGTFWLHGELAEVLVSSICLDSIAFQNVFFLRVDS